MAKLSVVATPIGNLEDCSPRAIRTLKEASLVVTEDTRVTRKLLTHFGIKTPTVSIHEYSDERAMRSALERLASGGHVALVTDAGTPGVSDPGARFVELATARVADLTVEAVPGPSALTAALSVSGMRAEPFTFLGFAPAKKGRSSFFSSLRELRGLVVLFEAPHRIGKTLEGLMISLGPSRRAYVGRELTKFHETHYRGSLAEVTAAVKADTVKGEYVIVVGPA